MDDLTKDAKYLLGKIYAEYLANINNGITKTQAKIIGSSQSINENLVPEEIFEDTDETMKELGRTGYVKNTYADNVVYFSVLTDKSIIYMENRFKNDIKAVFSFLSKLKS